MALPRRNLATLLSTAIASVAVLVLVGVVLTVRSAGTPATPSPEPAATAPSPEPEPEPEPPAPVEGEIVGTELVDLSAHGTGLFSSGRADDAPVEADEAEVEALVTAVADWLDAHLSDLQLGGPGLVGEEAVVGPAGVLALTDPDHLVQRADYRMLVGTRGAPEWVQVEVEVVRTDGSTSTAELGFVPGDPPRLVGAQGEDGP